MAKKSTAPINMRTPGVYEDTIYQQLVQHHLKGETAELEDKLDLLSDPSNTRDHRIYEQFVSNHGTDYRIQN